MGILRALLVIVFSLGCFASCDTKKEAPHQMGGGYPSPQVEVVTIQPHQVTLSKELPGRTAAYRVAEIRPQVHGIITKRFFTEGSDVKAGEQLYQIDQAPYQAAYDSAKADLLKAEALLKSAEVKAKRFKELALAGCISEQEYDDASCLLAQAEADIAIRKAALEREAINLRYTKVLSPISGRIGKSQVSEGALVTANQLEPLAVVQQIDKIYVDITESCSEIMKLRRHLMSYPEATSNQTVTLITDWETDGQIVGELQFSDIVVDKSSGTIALRALFANPNYDLLPGLFVRVRHNQAEHEKAITVPQRAVIRQAGGAASVWVVDQENKVHLQPVTLSEGVGRELLVTTGLQPGDRVVTEGILKIMPDLVVVATEKERLIADRQT